MSKLICDICGTSYPDTSTQCPICGCVRPADSSAVADYSPNARSYTYVKGGRFSKSNVKKRNTSSGYAAGKSSPKKKGKKQSSSQNLISLVIVVVLLSLIVACMVGFIIFYSMSGNDGNLDLFGKDETSSNDFVEYPCTGITLSKSLLVFKEIGEDYTLKTIFSPTNTTDIISFSSSDESVATVTQDGKVVCVGAGEALIYVYCGEQMDECHVQCNLETEPEAPTETEEAPVFVKLSRENITDANFPGYSWDLYEPCSIKAEDLTWVTENPSVATVSTRGVVTAIAEGSTVIRVYYNDQEVASCSITCDFSQQEEVLPEGNGNYAPYVPVYGLYLPYEEDKGCYTATLALNEWIDIVLRDPDNPQDKVKVVWTIVEGDCRLDSDGTGLTATSQRNCKLKAEYNGNIYYILIY